MIDIKSLADWLRYARTHLGEAGAEPFVFVSSALPDQDAVDRALPILADALNHLKCPRSGECYRIVHYAHPQTGTPIGSFFPEEISKWMWNCRGAVLVWSQHFLGSRWCREIEAPSLAWRREKQGLPLFTLRLGPTVRKSDVISVDDGSGAPFSLDVGLLTDDRNPKNNRGVGAALPGAWLPDLTDNDFTARLVAVAEEIAERVEERWRGVPAAAAATAASRPAVSPPPSPGGLRVEWKGDFSAEVGAVEGRETDLRRLTEGASWPDVAVMAVTALGGQGKTALVRAWIEGDVRAGRTRPFEGVFAFGFYHGQTQEMFARELAAFLDPAAAALAPGAPPPVRLVEMLQGRRILLFLDGLEEIQNKERAGDEAPLSQGPVLDLLFSLCVQEASKSLAVITSRLHLAGFQEFEDTRLVRIKLEGLAPSAGGRLLRDLGVTSATQAKREEYSSDLMGHPLLLHVFADAVRRRALSLDFGNAAEKVAEAMEVAAPIEFKDKLSRVVERYRDQFSAQERAIIEAVAVFGGTATIQRIRAYLREQGRARSGAGEAAIARQIETLETAGILQSRDDAGMRSYSCHPILREVFRPGEAGARSAVTISLYSRPTPVRPGTLAEAETYLEVIGYETNAGDFEEASRMLERHLDFGDLLDGFVGGQRALLDCLLGFLNPNRRVTCEAKLGRPWLVAMVPKVVMASMALDEWEIADEYARWDAELTADDTSEAKRLSFAMRARVAAEIGAADEARNLYAFASTLEDENARGMLMLERAELERLLGAPRDALRLIRDWMAMDQSLEAWISGWDQALETLARIVRRPHPGLALRCATARGALRKARATDDQSEDNYMRYELLDLKPRAERTRDDWQRLLELAEQMERYHEFTRSRALGSWPIGRAAALNGLGRAAEAERLAWSAIHRLHKHSWRRLWFKVEIARARLQQGQISLGLQSAVEILKDAWARQRYLSVRDAAELIVEYGGADAQQAREAQRLLDQMNERLRPADGDIPELGPLPGEPGWDGDLTRRLLREVRPEQRDTPATAEELSKALVLAAELELSGAILELLRLGVSQGAVASALEAAVKRGHGKLVETLLRARSRPFDLEDERDRAIAAAAIGASNDGILKRLLQASAAKPVYLTLLLAGAAGTVGSGETVRVLCDAGADPGQLQNSQHPLVRAARAGNLSAVETLAERIGDVNKAVDGDGETALMAAMGAGQEPIIVWLIDHGARLDARDDSGETAIDYAVQRGEFRALELLAAVTGRDVLAEIEPTALAVGAAVNGRVEELRRAIGRGARVDGEDSQGRTPLVAAADRGHLDAIRAMREMAPDLDIDAQEGSGRTALMAAAWAGRAEVAAALVKEFGARLDLADEDDEDAITYALAGNEPEMIRLLTSLGARPRPVEATIAAVVSAAGEGSRDAVKAFLIAVAQAGWLEQLGEQLGVTPLPGDAEAATDALMAAAAGRSRRDAALALPVRAPEQLSESDLENQPCVVLQAGARTYADLPLADAPQALIARFAAASAAGAIANIDAFDLARLRVAETPWLGGRLAFLPHRESKIEVPFFVDDQSIALAGRTNEWIYSAMSGRPPPQLDAILLAYVRFFFATVVGQLGAFWFADRVEDAIWLPEASEATKREFAEKLIPLHIVGTSDDGRQELRGTVIFKNALFVTSVMVAPNWEMVLANEDLLMEELPIAFGTKISLLVRR